MKTRKVLSGLLLGLGCATTFVGFLAALLSKVENEQFRLVVESFHTPSRFALVNGINACMRFTMQNCWAVLGVGILGVLLGMLLFSRFAEAAPEPPRPEVQRPLPLHSRPVGLPSSSDLATEPNPFAVASIPDDNAMPTFAPQIQKPAQSSSAFLAYHSPILEENRIDEPASRPSSACVQASTAASEPEEAGAAEQEQLSQKSENPALRPVVSMRIRSTMGRHSQW